MRARAGARGATATGSGSAVDFDDQVVAISVLSTTAAATAPTAKPVANSSMPQKNSLGLHDLN